MNKCFKNQLITLAFAASVFVMPLGAQASAYNRAQLDKIAAPIALYPDTLLGSVLVASTYPDQVIDAYNWTVSYQALTQGQKESLIASQPWDDSVKTLALIPETLEMMVGDMAWTDSLSQAFVTQQDSLCESIQGLRRRAKMNGALRDGNYIRVVDSGNYIVINSVGSACTAVPVYTTAVYNYSPAQVVLNTVLSWTTVRILDSLFYGGSWDWRHHEVYMSRGHHYHVPHSVVPPYRPQLHPPVRHVAHKPEPPKPHHVKPVPPPPKPHHAEPVPPPKPHHAEPVPAPKPHRAEPVPPPKPHHAEPVPAPKPHRAEPVPPPKHHHAEPVPAPKPHRAEPVPPPKHHHAEPVPAPKPHKAEPVPPAKPHGYQPSLFEQKPLAHKPAAEPARPQGVKPASPAKPHGLKPGSSEHKPSAHRSAARPSRPEGVKPAAAPKPQGVRPAAEKPKMQDRPKGTSHVSSDRGKRAESHHGFKPGDKKHKR